MFLQFLHYFQDQWLFCCSAGDANNNSCQIATKGSTAPFPIEAGKVIFNRTSGSTSPNNTNTTPVTITATVTATASAPALESSSLSANSTSSSSSSSSRTGTAVGAGVSGLLGLVLLVTLGLLWREKKHKEGFKKDAQTWEGKCGELVQTQNVFVETGGAEHQPPHEFDGWSPNELYGEPPLPHQLEGWRPGEMDGTQVP